MTNRLSFDFTGTSVLVTGGTSGIGHAVATAFSGAGASVTVVAGSLTEADIDATAAYALGDEAVRWLGGRPGRSALVVWADGRTTTVEPVLPA